MAQANGDILLYGPIVDEGTAAFARDMDLAVMSGVEFRRQLEAIDGDARVRINSPGGDVWESSLIQGAIKEHQARGHAVNGLVEGLAASAAAFVTLPMDSVAMYRAAEMMIHSPSMCVCGDVPMLETALAKLSGTEEMVVSVYAERMGKTTDETRTILRATRFYTASEAVEAGLAHEMIETTKPPEADGDDDTGDGAEMSAAAEPRGRVETMSRFLHLLN